MAKLVQGQECPQSIETISSVVQTLEGSLIFHDGIRDWFELKLKKPKCGQDSVELYADADNAEINTSLEVLRGCHVISKGSINFSPTGYYSREIFQRVDDIKPIGDCVQKPPFPDYSKAKPDTLIEHYRVDMYVNYTGDNPIILHITNKGKELQPWQAYASYLLTGSLVLYAWCGKGFIVDKVFGTPQAHPDNVADMAAFYPESAAASGKKNLHLVYTCTHAQ